ncbi:MAG: phosphatase PAP2 family protein, partial [Candidatus Rokuibacteriota bacterium]
MKLPRAVTLLAVISALSFLALAAVASTQHVFSLDYTVQAWVQGERHPVLEAPMRALTLLGSGGVLAVLSAIGYLVLRRAGHPLARPLPAIVVGAFLLNVVTKGLVSRPRPRGTEYGFPSGHALGAAIFFGGVIFALWTSGLPRAWRWAGTALACLLVLSIAYSRLYLKVHWA